VVELLPFGLVLLVRLSQGIVHGNEVSFLAVEFIDYGFQLVVQDHLSHVPIALLH
jgi:hypothetical protein